MKEALNLLTFKFIMFNSGEKGYRYETKYFNFLKISIVMNCANDHTWSRRGKRS